MAFMPPFFSGSSAAPDYVGLSIPVVNSQQAPVFYSGMERDWAVRTPGGSESLWVPVHSPVGSRSHLQGDFHFRVHIRGTQPFCRLSLVSFCQAPAMDDLAPALAEMSEWGVPLRFEA